jgi:hypothetical protein
MEKQAEIYASSYVVIRHREEGKSGRKCNRNGRYFAPKEEKYGKVCKFAVSDTTLWILYSKKRNGQI